MKRIGYARVSTHEQLLDLQVSALTNSGCDLLFTDQGISGAKFERPGLAKTLSTLEAGDMLVVWRLDRLGRSLIELIRLIDALGDRGVEFRSLSESIDTSSSGGRLTFHLMGAMAEFERAIISERTRAGMAAARAKGHRIGRRPALTDKQKIEARRAIEKMRRPLEEVAERYGVHPRTLSRLIREHRKLSPATC